MAHNLYAIRQAHIAWMDRAYARGVRHNDCGIPHGAVAVGVWLLAHGWHGKSCLTEQLTGWGPDRYRLYASALSDKAYGEELEDARRILFTGVHPLAPMAIEPAQVAA